MSRSEAERACFELRGTADRVAFQSDPGRYLDGYELDETERRAIINGDVGTLYNHGLIYGAIDALARLFGYGNETYVIRLRQAAGLPILGDQIELLRRRAAARRRN
jgi:hypothetical protein